MMKNWLKNSSYGLYEAPKKRKKAKKNKIVDPQSELPQEEEKKHETDSEDEVDIPKHLKDKFIFKK